MCCRCSLFFFFFQAEDGIRDRNVTGVQTCALPISVSAMDATVLSARELIGSDKDFWGGMRIRLRPQARQAMPASDLFSSAFVRWHTENSFDNVHANPDPLQWQKAESFYYSMPYPPLTDYICTFVLFNPNKEPSAGHIVLFDRLGNKTLATRYELTPYSSLLLSLNTGEILTHPGEAFGPSKTAVATSAKKAAGG